MVSSLYLCNCKSGANGIGTHVKKRCKRFCTLQFIVLRRFCHLLQQISSRVKLSVTLGPVLLDLKEFAEYATVWKTRRTEQYQDKKYLDGSSTHPE